MAKLFEGFLFLGQSCDQQRNAMFQRVNAPARKIELKEAIHIGSDKKLVEFVRWKKHRSVEIENMCMNKYDVIFFHTSGVIFLKPII